MFVEQMNGSSGRLIHIGTMEDFIFVLKFEVHLNIYIGKPLINHICLCQSLIKSTSLDNLINTCLLLIIPTVNAPFNPKFANFF